MGYEKDYDLRFGNFLYLLSLRFRHHKVMGFHRSLWNEKNSKKFVIYSHSVLLSIEFVVNSVKCLKAKLFFDYPQLWITLFVTIIIFF